MIVILLIYQYRAKRPLLCIRPLGSTLPVSGIAVAMCAAASSISAVALAAVLLTDKFSPVHLGLLQFPEFIAALITAVVLGVVFRTRGLHYLVLGGMLSLIAGILVLLSQLPPTSLGMAIGSGLVGLGVGGSVAPALFIAGFSLRNNALQRVFAIIELLRGVAAFAVGPVLVHVAMTVGGSPAEGTRTALWICFGIASAGTLFAVSLYALGGVRPPAPALETWQSGEAPAWYSPPLLDRIRDSSERDGSDRAACLRRGRTVRRPAQRRLGGARGRSGRRGDMSAGDIGPVLFAYDGSELAGLAIDEAARQLAGGRDAVVLTVWRPYVVGFIPAPGVEFNAAASDEVRRAAEQTAAHGASLAQAAGFRAESLALTEAPTWKGIARVANDRDASLIALGSHGKSGFAGVFLGSVAADVAAHSGRTVLIVHRRA